jgi:hypothetical protein
LSEHNIAYQTLEVVSLEGTELAAVLVPMDEKFIGLSRNSLQDAQLSRLAKLANLRKSSRQHRQALSDIRSEIALTHHELGVIEGQLGRIVSFPAVTPAEKEHRILGKSKDPIVKTA